MRLRLFIAPIALVLVLSACQEQADEHQVAVARVDKAVLYEEELEKQLPEDLPEEDLLRLRQQLISNWIKDQVLFQAAEKNLPPDELDKDAELEQYYRSLLTHDFRKYLLSNFEDTLITPEEVAAYYRENERNFQLKRNIVRLLYVKVEHSAPDIDRLRSWVRNPHEVNLERISAYCTDFAVNCALDTGVWYYFDNITKEVPLIENYDPTHFIRYNRFVELRDSSYFYFIKILDRRIKDDISPLSLEQSRIREILRNRKQVEYLRRRERELYQKALGQNKIELYQP